jgi:dolichol-phosphate mannosyltransferase
MTSMELSVIVPVYNEERVIEVFHRALVEVLDGLGFPCEIIYVNDGSRDQTGDRLDALRASDSRVRLLELSRNFGHQSALAHHKV